MTELVETYFNENPSIIHCLKSTTKSNQVKTIKEHWKKWIKTFENKSKITIAKELLENWQTLDTYSLMVLYYRFMKENVQMETQAPFVDTYINILETYIVSKPAERQLPKAMYKQLQTFSKSINRKDFLKWNQALVEHQKKPDVMEAEKASIQKDLEDNKKLEDILLKKKQERI